MIYGGVPDGEDIAAVFPEDTGYPLSPSLGLSGKLVFSGDRGSFSLPTGLVWLGLATECRVLSNPLKWVRMTLQI